MDDPARADRYLILRRLGEGGLGVVDEAFDPLLQRKVALKRLRLGPTGSAAWTAHSSGASMLVQEARTLAKLDHPNIVKVLDVGEIDNGIFVAMELIRGQSLRQLCRQKNPTWRTWLEIYLQAAQGLAAAHRAGIIHRDFKPDNVMIDDDGRVIVLDFGLAVPNKVETIHQRATNSVDAIGLQAPSQHFGGTPAYMPKEQHLGALTSAASDQFSFALSLFECIVGERPLMTDDHEIDYESLPTRTRFGRGSCPKWLYDLLLRSMSTEPSQRLSAMDDWIVHAQTHLAQRRLLPLSAIAGASLVALTTFLAQVIANPNATKCQAFAHEVDGVWNVEVANRIKQTITAAATPFSSQAIAMVNASLQTFVESWQNERWSTCMDEQSGDRRQERLNVQKIQCLGKQIEIAKDVLAIFEQPSQRDLERTYDILQSVPLPEKCEDPQSHHELDPLVTNPAQREKVKALRAAFDELKFDTHVRGGKNALARNKELLERIARADSPHLMMESVLELAHWESFSNNILAANHYRQRAYLIAVGLGADDGAFLAASHLALYRSMEGILAEVADFWIPASKSSLVRTDNALIKQAGLMNALGVFNVMSGRQEKAVDYFEQAVFLHILGSKDKWTIARLIHTSNFAHALTDVSRYDDAEQVLEPAVRNTSELVGSRHPLLLTARRNLGFIKMLRGNLKEAREIDEFVYQASHDHYGGFSRPGRLALVDMIARRCGGRLLAWARARAMAAARSRRQKRGSSATARRRN